MDLLEKYQNRIKKYEQVYKAMLNNTITEDNGENLQDLLKTITTAQLSAASASDVVNVDSSDNNYSYGTYTGDLINSGNYPNWTVSPSYNYSTFLRTVFNIDNLDIQENGTTIPFKEWLKNFIKETIETDLLEINKYEIPQLKDEIAQLRKAMEDVFQEAAVTKLERLAQEDNK